MRLGLGCYRKVRKPSVGIRLRTSRSVKAGFEFQKPALQLPLLLGFFAGAQERFTSCGFLLRAGKIFPARSNGRGENIARLPKTVTGQKVMLQSRARELLEIGVVEVVSLRRAN